MNLYYFSNLYRLFTLGVGTRPDNPALVLSAHERIDFASLHGRSEVLAADLASCGIGRGDVVGIFHSKTLDGYALMLACIKLGAPYVNLDDENPPDRLKKILAACQPRLLVADGPVANPAHAGCAEVGQAIVGTDRLRERSLAGSGSRCSQVEPVIGSDVAYIMFTSGSTGIPKGVAISHAQAINFIAWAREEFGIGPGDVVSNTNPMYFDNSVFDFFASLFNGAALAPLPRALLKDPLRLVEQVADVGCTVWFSVPTLLIYLNATRILNPDTWPAMRLIVFGGEGYPKPELRKIFDLFGTRARLVNVYGPTECTCICSAYDVTRRDFSAPGGLPPIGRLAANFRGLLLDGEEPVPNGQAGELCLLGPNVGLGYYCDAERTRAVFVPNPLCNSHEERMYRTGDLMRLDPDDGLLHFVARKDNQIKHMGYRIELEEIEAALGRLAGVRQCAVVYRRGQAQFGHIVAYVSGNPEQLDATCLADQMRAALPHYMVPRIFEIREELPRNANGKVDRRSLTEGI